MKYSTMLMAALLGAGAAQAQTGPLIAELKANYQGIKNDVTKGAEKMPEADYSFRPIPQRSYGDIITHIAEIQIILCGMAKGEQKHVSNPKASTKAESQAALKEAFDYCDPVYNGLTEASATEMVKMFGRDRSRFGVLNFGVIHGNEMYGQMVVYLRMKGLCHLRANPEGAAEKRNNESAQLDGSSVSEFQKDRLLPRAAQ